MTVIPPYLKPGDTIGVVAPAGYMPFEKMQTCIDTLQQWGYTVVTGETTQSSSPNYFSGSDEERIADVQAMLDDRNIQAIFCARGGYGVSRIIDQLKFKKFRKHPKWIVGFSDITVFHAHLYSRYNIASLHAPMAAAFNEEGDNNPYIQSLRHALEGKEAEYRCDIHDFNNGGETSGVLVGGNLTLLAHLVGTKSELDTRNKILFLEDVGEYLYNIDRMMLQLKRSGAFKKLAGLVIGGFSDCRDTERPFGRSAYEIIYDQVKEYDYPICFGFPVSHYKENYALKVGVEYELQVGTEEVRLQE